MTKELSTRLTIIENLEGSHLGTIHLTRNSDCTVDLVNNLWDFIQKEWVAFVVEWASVRIIFLNLKHHKYFSFLLKVMLAIFLVGANRPDPKIIAKALLQIHISDQAELRLKIPLLLLINKVRNCNFEIIHAYDLFNNLASILDESSHCLLIHKQKINFFCSHLAFDSYSNGW